MAYEQKPNSGALFTSQGKKTPNDKYPDRTGNALITCPECNRSSAFWISAWLKTTEAGKRWLSMSFSPKTEAAPRQTPASHAAIEKMREIVGAKPEEF